MNIKFPLLASAATALLLSAGALTSCSDDDDNKISDSITFRQVLRVEQWNDGTTNAFADFMVVNTQTNKLMSIELPSKPTSRPTAYGSTTALPTPKTRIAMLTKLSCPRRPMR